MQFPARWLYEIPLLPRKHMGMPVRMTLLQMTLNPLEGTGGEHNRKALALHYNLKITDIPHH